MPSLNEYLTGLEPETQKVFGQPHNNPASSKDVDQAIRHSLAVSAAKARKTELELTEQLKHLNMSVHEAMLFGIRVKP